MTSASRRYQRGRGQEIETCTLSYLELARMVRIYHSEGPGQMQRESQSFDAPTVADGRRIFGEQHGYLVASGWVATGTDVRSATDEVRQEKPEQGD